MTSSLEHVPEPRNVRFEEASMWVELSDGRTLGLPLAWYPRLKDADLSALNDFFLTPSGVHWEALDEDLSVRGMLLGLKDQTAVPARAA